MNREALAAALGRAVVAVHRVPGGDLNEAFVVELGGGGRAFVKTSVDAAPGAYAFEAASLQWLAAADALPVPAVLAVTENFLALEWVQGSGARTETAHDEAFGRGLALLHRAGADTHGSLPPNAGDRFVLGPLSLPNDPAPDWPSFYGANRLLAVARMAADRGSLAGSGVRAIERVAERIDELSGPSEPPARLHGDLWSGNVHTDVSGCMWLIDPAAY